MQLGQNTKQQITNYSQTLVRESLRWPMDGHHMSVEPLLGALRLTMVPTCLLNTYGGRLDSWDHLNIM